MLHVCFSEKCYETTHLRYYDTGESWGRIHLRNVEQCTCVAGEIECERVGYTSKIRRLCRPARAPTSVLIVVSGTFVIRIKPVQKVSVLLPRLCFDQTSMVTTSPWMKRQIIWLTVTQEWCCRTHPMGLRGVFISKGHVCGHSTFLRTKDSEVAGWFMLPEPKQDFFCHGGRGLFYPPWENNCLF